MASLPDAGITTYELLLRVRQLETRISLLEEEVETLNARLATHIPADIVTDVRDKRESHV